MNKLSHSAVSRYQLCGESYRLHYKEKIRTVVQSGALAFGSALDSALNELLLPTGKNPEEIFITNFTYTKINNEEVYLPTHTNVVYANTDFDAELLTKEDFDFIDNHKDLPQPKDKLEYYSNLKKRKSDSGFDSLDDREKSFYNIMNWVSMKAKGLIMLKGYREKILPKFDEVLSVQEWISLENENGDEVTGVVDLVARLKNGDVVILDNKTSAMEYEADSVVTSPQLSLYVHALCDKYKTRKAGYIVLKKQLKKNRVKICSSCNHDGGNSRAKTCDNIIEGKRCGGVWNETIAPEVSFQFIVDEIPEKLEEMVIQNYDAINNAIQQEVYTKNFASCTNTYGGKCPFFNLCHKGSMDGLVDLKKKT